MGVDTAGLIHGLSNLNLLDAQNGSVKSQLSPDKSANSQSRAFKTLAGMDYVLNALRELIGWPVVYAKEAADVGIRWPRGVLLHGPSGTGKSVAVAKVAQEYNAIVHLVTAGSIIGSFVGESERRLREVFAKAENDAEHTGRPVIIFLDDVDTLCPRRQPGQQHEARLVGQLLTLLDGASTPANCTTQGFTYRGSRVVVVAATSRPNALDPALRRPGRLEREVAVGIPSPENRAEILKALVADHSLASSHGFHGACSDEDFLDLDFVASRCHGYTGADLESLFREVTMHILSNDTSKNNDSDHPTAPQLKITTQDFMEAMKRVGGASVARSVAKEFPPAHWHEIGGLHEVKKRLIQAVEWPLTKREAFKRLNIRSPRGVLLHGPPGCAKTTLARAAATSSGATFIPLQGTSLYSMYVGEGEAELREAFRKARLASPSIIFIDELDMLVGKRGRRGGSQSSSSNVDSSARLLSTFLNEMDGLETSFSSSGDHHVASVLVLATTNRPDAIDSALLRPGRFDVTLYVPPPDAVGRFEALQVHTRNIPLANDVDLQQLAGVTEFYTGAELAAVCREAAMAALREDVEGAEHVAARHFEAAVRGVRPALTQHVLDFYSSWPPRKTRAKP